MKVLLMTIQNAPPGLDYDRDKRFSKSFKEMVAMCLVKDQTKRPTAEKLLKHSFFKNAKPPELSVKKLLADLPPLWKRVKDLQLKDAAQLALKKMPSAEQEAISQSEYQRGVSAWNFDVEDLKLQASLLQEEDDVQEIKEEDSLNLYMNHKVVSSSGPEVENPGTSSNNICREKINGDEEKVFENDLPDSDNQGKTGINRSVSKAELPMLEKESAQAKTIIQMGKPRQTQSGPLMPGLMLSHSNSERTRNLERCEIENHQAVERAQQLRKAPSYSGPLMLPNRASANSLSAPIKSSGGFKDSMDDKSKTNLIQIKGRFSVTSENVDLVKGSPLRKSASVGEWMFDSKPMPNSQSLEEISNRNVPASVLMPHLQNLFQQTSIQQDLIMNLLNSLQLVEVADAPQNGKLPLLPCGSENNGIVESALSERERMLLMKITELQSRMVSLTDELNAERLKYMQLQQQLNTISGRVEDRDRREGDS